MAIHELRTSEGTFHHRQGLRLEDSNIFNATNGIIDTHPEAYPSVRTIVERAGLHISSRRARVVLSQAGIFVKSRTGKDGWNRYNISANSEAAAVSHLQHLFFKEAPKVHQDYTLDNLTRGAVERHPEKFSTLGNALKQARCEITTRRFGEIAEKLARLGFKIGKYSQRQVRGNRTYEFDRYCVMTNDLPELISYLKKAKWVLSGETTRAS